MPWLHCGGLTYLALKIAQKHESTRRDRDQSQVRKSIIVGPASSWSEFELAWFGVTFDSEKYDSLSDDVFKAIPKTDTESKTNIKISIIHYIVSNCRVGSVARGNNSCYTGGPSI